MCQAVFGNGAGAYDQRFAPYGDTTVAYHPGGFNVKQFHSTLVLRWEYRPASALVLVWTQGRQASLPAEGGTSFVGDFRNLFAVHPENLIFVKASYWLSW